MSEQNPFLWLKKRIPILMATESGTRQVCRRLFLNDEGKPFELASYQVRIIRMIFFKTPKKIVITATTRAGKSKAMALGIVLLAVFYPGRKIRIIAPTLDHTKIVMGYIIQHVLDHEICSRQLLFETKGMGVERLKKELTKQKLTLKDNCEIMAITANIAGAGRSLIGWGATDLFIDEGEQIDAEILRAKAMRMLGDTPDSSVFMIGNPVKYGYMFEKHTDPKWKYINIDCWECIREGRLTKEFVEERKAEMLPNEFKVWMLGQWPDELENQLFPAKALKKMFAPLTYEETELLKSIPDKKALGTDVARFGNDLTVLHPTYWYGEKIFFLEPRKFEKQDTMKTVGENLNWDRVEKFSALNVDDPGVGGGVVDRLKEIEEVSSKVNSFNAGERPHKLNRKLTKQEEEDNKNHLNKKAFWYKKFSVLAAQGKIRVVPSAYSQLLHGQLRQLLYDFTSNGHLKIVDEKENMKSPDFADAASISMFSGPQFAFGFA